MAPDERFKHLVYAVNPTALDGRQSSQDCLSCHHSFALTLEDRPEADCVQEFLWKNGRRDIACSSTVVCHSEDLVFGARNLLLLWRPAEKQIPRFARNDKSRLMLGMITSSGEAMSDKSKWLL